MAAFWGLGRPTSRSARLVATAVALVVAVSVLIGASATLAVRSYLVNQLDQDVAGSLQRAANAPAVAYLQSRDSSPDGDCSYGPGDGDGDNYFGQGVGTLTGYYATTGSNQALARGDIIDPGHGTCGHVSLSKAALTDIANLPTDGRARTVRLPDAGSYRVAVAQTKYGRVAAGLPTHDVDQLVGTLVTWEVLLVLGGSAIALAAGLVVVRRQLRPLREVAGTAHHVSTLPLATGEISLDERVPERLTDERTEVGRVGAALNRLLEHVETSLESRHRSEVQVRQFVADASHELRTPLATIAGYTQLARRRPGDQEAVSTALEKVTEESARMTALVEDLLLLARLDAGRPLDRAPVDISRLLVEAVTDARVVAPDHHWRLELPDQRPDERSDDGLEDPDDEPGPGEVVVVGDEQRLHQVLTNLLTNARKYTPPGSTITVSARPDGFAVHDDGPGFAPDLVDRAFERFTRGDTARTREGGGVGLGLSLVEAIVAAHGGSVSLTSRPGDTTVGVVLPTPHRS